MRGGRALGRLGLTVGPAAPAGDRPRLSVVLPARSTPQRRVEQRLAHLAFDTRLPEGVEFLCVDEGSEPDCAAALREACAAAGVVYLGLPTTGEPFSIARARNFGALAARGDYLLFQDLDLVPHPGFYAGLLREIEFQGLAARRDEFLVIPVAYLTEAASERLLRPGYFEPQTVLDAIVSGDAGVLESYAPVSSCVVLHRDYYLALGGQRADFVGWGYEDWEFAYRLMRRARRFPPPRDFDRDDYASFANEGAYRGWRAAFQLYGDTSLRRGLFLTHAHHPAEAKRRGDAGREANRNRFLACLAEVRAGREPRFDLLGHVRILAAAGRPPLPVTLVVGASPLARSRGLQAALTNPLAIERLAGSELEDPLAALAAAGLRLAAAVVEEPQLDRRRAALFLRLRNEVPTLVLGRLGLSDCFFLDAGTDRLCAGSLEAWSGGPPASEERRARLRRSLARELPSARGENPPETAVSLFVTTPTRFRLEGETLRDEAALDLLAAVEERLAFLPPARRRLTIHCPRHLARRFAGSGHDVRPLQDLDAAIAASAFCVFQHDGLALRGLLHGKPCFLPADSAFVAAGLARPLEALGETPGEALGEAAVAAPGERLAGLLDFLLTERASRLTLRFDAAASRRSRLRLELGSLCFPDGRRVAFAQRYPAAESARLLAQLHQAVNLDRVERRPAPRRHDRRLSLLLQAGARPVARAPAEETWEEPERAPPSGQAAGERTEDPVAAVAGEERRRRRPRLLRLAIKLVRRPDLYLLDSRVPWLRRLGRRRFRD